MGQHFDTLVEVVNKCMTENEKAPGIPNVREYFRSLVKRFTLFEFPLDPKDIFPNSGKDKEEYGRYVWDYFSMSEKYDRFLITPFKCTAIEDPVSVVFLDQIGYGNYRVTLSKFNSEFGGKLKDTFCADVVCGDISVTKSEDPKRPILMDVMPLYLVRVLEGKRNASRVISPNNFLMHPAASLDLSTATNSFIEEIIYLMDPANFIVEKRHKQCELERERRERKKGKGPEILQKTIVRPHYICLSEDEMRDFFRERSKEARPVRPVAGHWKTLISERFVNKRGQRIFVAQYYRGEGIMEGAGGWRYQVWLKESPTKIRPYKRE